MVNWSFANQILQMTSMSGYASRISAMRSEETPQESMSRRLQFFISGRISRTAAPSSVMTLWFRSISSDSVLR